MTEPEFLEQLQELNGKINSVKEQAFRETVACADVQHVLEKLKIKVRGPPPSTRGPPPSTQGSPQHPGDPPQPVPRPRSSPKAVTKIREFVLQKIYSFRKPMTNYQIPQNALLKYRWGVREGV